MKRLFFPLFAGLLWLMSGTLSATERTYNYGGKNEACQYVVGLKMGDCFGFQSVMVE